MLDGNLYCRTQEALDVAFAKLREIGYDIRDVRVDEKYLEQNSTTPSEMEQQGHALWYASLPGIRWGKCGSCQQLIDTRGIQSHGHACEKCGEVTRYELPKGSQIRFKFRGSSHRAYSPELNMEVVHWDADGGWLYLVPTPLDHVGLCVVTGEKAQEYLDKHADQWELTEYDGQPALKVCYIRQGVGLDRSASVDALGVVGMYSNHEFVRVWKGVEYPASGPSFPLPESIHVYELWHRAVATL